MENMERFIDIILNSYKIAWIQTKGIPSVDDILEITMWAMHDQTFAYIKNSYEQLGLYEDLDRVERQGLSGVDYKNAGYEEEVFAEDIHSILESCNYTFYDDLRILQNEAQIKWKFVRKGD